MSAIRRRVASRSEILAVVYGDRGQEVPIDFDFAPSREDRTALLHGADRTASASPLTNRGGKCQIQQAAGELVEREAFTKKGVPFMVLAREWN